MGGNYEDVTKETKEAIIKFTTIVPEVTVQSKPNNPVYVERHTPSSDEKEVDEPQ